MHKIVESTHRNLNFFFFYCIWQLICQYQLQCTVWTSDFLYTASIGGLCGYECIKGYYNIKTFVHGCSLNLNSSVIERLINQMLDLVPKQHRMCWPIKTILVNPVIFFNFALFFFIVRVYLQN